MVVSDIWVLNQPKNRVKTSKMDGENFMENPSFKFHGFGGFPPIFGSTPMSLTVPNVAIHRLDLNESDSVENFKKCWELWN